MTIEMIMGYVSTVGFPIAITCYVLFRLEKRTIENTTALNKLNLLIEAFLNQLKK